jgi:AcrR family transcriptional regulator
LVIALNERELAFKSEAATASSPGDGALRILRAAIRLFIREGGAAFTARGVAKEAGVSLGAVQHFFPTKDQLLAAMLERVLADYGRMYEKLSEDLPFNGEARLLGVIDCLVADIWRPDTRKFFFNLFALSCHNAFAAQLLNEVYSHHRHRLAVYIGAARPHLSEQDCFDLAMQIAALVDGLMIYTAPGAKSVTPRERLAEMVKQIVLRLISNPSASRAT